MPAKYKHREASAIADKALRKPQFVILTNRYLGAILGISDSVVSRRRRALEATGEIPETPRRQSATGYWLDTTNMGEYKPLAREKVVVELLKPENADRNNGAIAEDLGSNANIVGRIRLELINEGRISKRSNRVRDRVQAYVLRPENAGMSYGLISEELGVPQTSVWRYMQRLFESGQLERPEETIGATGRIYRLGKRRR